MNRELICSILEVPTEPWPPDHYALIGLEPAQVTPVAVEQRVQELSARLRAYQLTEPELVTDALNRLAQALNCLTDPTARRIYDLARVGTIALAPIAPTPPPVSRPAIAEIESAGDAQLSARRRLYRRLCAVRRLRWSWLELGRWFDASGARPRELLDQVDLIRAARSVRTAWASDPLPSVGIVNSPGGYVIALIRDASLLRRLQRLKLSDLEKLSADWTDGLSAIDREITSTRARLRRRGPIARRFRRAGYFLGGNGIDITLCTLGLLALGIAIWRGWN
jgi:hypothetical protein